MPSREDQKEATRRAVLEAAREEFERVGFEAANLRGIAASAEVSAGTIIHHFRDKRQLLHAALFDDLQETLEAAVAEPGPGPLEAQLMRLTEGVFGYYQSRSGLSKTLLKESLFADEPWASKFAGQVGMVHEAIARWATEAIERGELTSEVDVPLLGVAYFSFFYFALMAWVQGAHDAPVALFSRLLDQHLKGFRPADEPHRKRREP